MKPKQAHKKIENNMKQKTHTANSVEDFINNTHKLIKEHKKNIYPKDIKGLFERLGIE
jgi:methionine salvage enolase-phosphatase E1